MQAERLLHISKLKISANPWVLIVAAVLFVFHAVIGLNLNIHGDAKFHTQYAKESAESGVLVREQPYRIFTVQDGHRRYMPITYPLTSEALFTTIYLLNGETALKLYAAFMAVVIFLLIYVLMRELGMLSAVVGGVVAVLSVGERLFMTPLMEPFALVTVLGGVLAVKYFITNDRSSMLIMAAVFFGSAAAIKQQGILTFVAITFLLTLLLAYRTIKNRTTFKRNALLLISFTMIGSVVPSFAIADQIQRTGTFAFSPGRTELPSSMPFHSTIQPLLESKYPANPDAAEAMKQQIGYGREKSTIFSKVKGFVLAPILFYRSVNRDLISAGIDMFYFLSLLILILAVIRFIMTRNLFWLSIMALLFFEIMFSFILKTPITQYHVFGVVLTVMMLTKSVSFLAKFSSVAAKIYIALGGLLFFGNYLVHMSPLWASNGRETDRNIEGYHRITDYVKKNTPPQSIFMAPEMSFRYNAKRDTLWLNEHNAHLLLPVMANPNAEEARQELRNLSIDYIIINQEQLSRYGVYDYLPPNGLAASIGRSPYFMKVYDPYGDGQIVVYRVEE